MRALIKYHRAQGVVAVPHGILNKKQYNEFKDYSWSSQLLLGDAIEFFKLQLQLLESYDVSRPFFYQVQYTLDTLDELNQPDLLFWKRTVRSGIDSDPSVPPPPSEDVSGTFSKSYKTQAIKDNENKQKDKKLKWLKNFLGHKNEIFQNDFTIPENQLDGADYLHSTSLMTALQEKNLGFSADQKKHQSSTLETFQKRLGIDEQPLKSRMRWVGNQIINGNFHKISMLAILQGEAGLPKKTVPILGENFKTLIERIDSGKCFTRLPANRAALLRVDEALIIQLNEHLHEILEGIFFSVDIGAMQGAEKLFWQKIFKSRNLNKAAMQTLLERHLKIIDTKTKLTDASIRATMRENMSRFPLTSAKGSTDEDLKTKVPGKGKDEDLLPLYQKGLNYIEEKRSFGAEKSKAQKAAEARAAKTQPSSTSQVTPGGSNNYRNRRRQNNRGLFGNPQNLQNPYYQNSSPNFRRRGSGGRGRGFNRGSRGRSRGRGRRFTPYNRNFPVGSNQRGRSSRRGANNYTQQNYPPSSTTPQTG